MPDAVQSSPLHVKISGILGMVGGIPKTGYNKFQNYNYVQEADVLDAIRPKLAEQAIAVYVGITDVHTDVGVSTTQGGTPQHLVTVQGEITFVDASSQESVSFGIAGQGMDAGDKGLPKAITMAVKYGLMKTFMLGTGDDAENETEAGQPIAPPTPAPVSRPAPPAAAPSTPPEPEHINDPAAKELPWETPEEAQAAKTAGVAPRESASSQAARVQSGREISDKQQKLVFARGKAADLTDAERDAIIQRISGQPKIDGIQWGDQLDEILEAIAAFGEHKKATA